MLINALKSFLLLIDMQEKLLPAMANAQEAEHRCGILLEAAKTLDVPVMTSEQYPKGLGHTVPSLQDKLGNAPVFEKSAFSCWRDEAMKAALIAQHEGGRPQAIMAGIESHVCVLQTAVDLAQSGFAVYAVADAMSSRAVSSIPLAHDRMRQEGVEIVSTEMAVFELLGRAGTPAFKALSALIR
ncbi:hydrolase [Aestuariivirga sp.]|uniref:hydrolase n=1 Tax=Aestuariivirga sp. TaxID=2650926 RepID=UPI0039E2CA5B